jgi:ribulose 1,5-bisphosphate synthetase/thiazole synthase
MNLLTFKKIMKKIIQKALLIGILISQLSFKVNSDKKEYKADIIVYGGSSAAVIAAVQAKKLGKTVIIVSPTKHLGGLSSGGLGFTDIGNK